MVHISGRLDPTAHTRQPWRIHAIAKGFRLEDVWALPARGGPGDFPRLLSLIRSLSPAESSPVVRALLAVRWHLGAWLALDRSDAGLDARVESLRTRLPDDLVGDTAPMISGALPFRPLYLTDREAAFEIANTTMHGVMHLGWVPDEAGNYRGQMAVLVKPNGLIGRAYMAAIAPFRHIVVYPQLLRSVSRRWCTGAEQVAATESIRALSTLPRVDYADTFLMGTGGHPDRTADEWAREILENAPAKTRAELLAGWSALGLKSTDSEESVLGWKIRRRTPESVLLGRDSRIGMPGELLFALSPDGLRFATFVHHRTGATRALWAAVEGTHVRTVLGLLDRAARDAVAVC